MASKLEVVEVEGLDVSPCCRNDRFKSLLASVALGQLLSLCLCGTGITSQILSRSHNVDTPTAQSFVNYLLLAFVYGTWIACRSAENGIIPVFRTRGWKYALLSAVDVEANFLLVKSYQFTNITSIQLLACFTIPVVLVLSFIFLKVRYLILHILGVFICLAGVGFLIWGDFMESKLNFAGGSDRLLGDTLCLAGATLYGCANVAEEFLLKNYDRVEYLGMVGIFGSIFSGVQVAIVDRTAIANVAWSNYDILALYGGFAACMFIFYSLVSVLIQRTSAAFFNISVLSGNVYILLVGLLALEYQLSYLYFVAFVLILAGIIIYSLRPTRSRRTTQQEASYSSFADRQFGGTDAPLISPTPLAGTAHQPSTRLGYSYLAASGATDLLTTKTDEAAVAPPHEAADFVRIAQPRDARVSVRFLQTHPVHTTSQGILPPEIIGRDGAENSVEYASSAAATDFPSVPPPALLPDATLPGLSSSGTSLGGSSTSTLRSVKFCPKHGVVYMDQDGKLVINNPS